MLTDCANIKLVVGVVTIVPLQKSLIAIGDADALAAMQAIQAMNVSVGSESIDGLFSSCPQNDIELLVQDLFAALHRDNNQIFHSDEV